MPPKQVYDQINQGSGRVFKSPSQGQELRDTTQVYRQKILLEMKTMNLNYFWDFSDKI